MYPLNENVRGLAPSATISINALSRQMQAEGRSVARLGLGQSPFPVPQVMRDALARHAGEKDYLPVKGLPALRQAIADWLRRTEGLDYDPEHVLVGPGTKELMFLLQLTYHGELVIPAPSWVSYAPQARIIGRQCRWLPTDIEHGLRVTPEALEAICRSDPYRARLLILNYPGNPTGASYGRDQLQAIAEVARRYRVVVLSDEIYSGLDFAGDHVSIARYYPEGTIVSNGLSKWAGAGGWRLGAFAFPDQLAWLAVAMAAVASETYTSTAAPIQYGAIAGFEDSGEMAAYLVAARQVMGAILGAGHRLLVDVGARLPEPDGGFYLFPDFTALADGLRRRGMTNSAQLCRRALEEIGVACLPGSDFGRPPEELSVRLACVDFDGARALAAASRLSSGELADEAFLRGHCNPTFTALERLCDWVGAGAMT